MKVGTPKSVHSNCCRTAAHISGPDWCLLQGYGGSEVEWSVCHMPHSTSASVQAFNRSSPCIIAQRISFNNSSFVLLGGYSIAPTASCSQHPPSACPHSRPGSLPSAQRHRSLGWYLCSRSRPSLRRWLGSCPARRRLPTLGCRLLNRLSPAVVSIAGHWL